MTARNSEPVPSPGSSSRVSWLGSAPRSLSSEHRPSPCFIPQEDLSHTEREEQAVKADTRLCSPGTSQKERNAGKQLFMVTGARLPGVLFLRGGPFQPPSQPGPYPTPALPSRPPSAVETVTAFAKMLFSTVAPRHAALQLASLCYALLTSVPLQSQKGFLLK